jgi:hypothetical protein
MLCRAAAIKLSRLQRALDAAGILLVGIGFDSEGYPEFKEGNYFSGQTYLSLDDEAYRRLGLGRAGVVASIGSVFRMVATRSPAVAEAQALGVTDGNLKGDGKGFCMFVISFYF